MLDFLFGSNLLYDLDLLQKIEQQKVVLEANMSINSIERNEVNHGHGEDPEILDSKTSASFTEARRAQARRRIEALREIQESGLSLEEARELGLID